MTYNKKVSEAVKVTADFTVDGLVEVTISVPKDKIGYIKNKHFKQLSDYATKWWKDLDHEISVAEQKKLQKKKGKTL